jgi:hypothetical protein
MMEAIRSSETSVLARATWRNIPEDGALHSYLCVNLKSDIDEEWLRIWNCGNYPDSREKMRRMDNTD